MDTIPFHFLMFALDVVLIMGLIYWPHRESTRWTLGGFFFLSFIGHVGIFVFARLSQTSLGQCAVEGIAYHGSAFLLAAAGFLFFRRLRLLAGLSALLGLSIFAIGFNAIVWEPYNLVVERYSIETPKLQKRLRIVFVSDIQTDRIGEYERRVLRTIQEQSPDLILFGGDYLQYFQGRAGVTDVPEQFRQLFEDAKLTAPLGVFAITGNIDPSHQSEFSLLFEGTTVEAIYDSETLTDWGIDRDFDPIDLTFLHYFHAVDGIGRHGLTDTGNFQIVVGHYPNFAIKDYIHAERAPDLMLAGHTHGGQVCLPFFGPIRIKYFGRDAPIPASMYSGLFSFENGSHLLVTRGIGMERGWAPRIRFLCRPEISVIDIKPEGGSPNPHP